MTNSANTLSRRSTRLTAAASSQSPSKASVKDLHAMAAPRRKGADLDKPSSEPSPAKRLKKVHQPTTNSTDAPPSPSSQLEQDSAPLSALDAASSSQSSDTAAAESAKDPSSQTFHTNTKLPESMVFTPTPPGATKIVAWNVAGLRASLAKGMMRYIEAEDADIVCLQETKFNAALSTDMFSRKQYPYQYWSHCTIKKGYSGVVVLSKVEPISVKYKIGDDLVDNEGRFVILEFQVRLDQKQKHYVKLQSFIKRLQETKPVIWSGDLNVAHNEIDLAHPKTNTKSAGFTPEERRDFGNLLSELDMVDSFRHKHPNSTGQYSYFSFRHNSRSNNVGWRLDYFVVSKSLVEHILEADIRSTVYGASDHVPVLLLLNLPLQSGPSKAELTEKKGPKLYSLFSKK
ncbi:exodeoxyribonuclease III [Batrachochytrium salamandrivorans]|nr:exodeoxyribonuclease III [Batrachochytrium salamandrivorans]